MYNFYNNALFSSSGSAFSDQSIPNGVGQLENVQNSSFAIDFKRAHTQYIDDTSEEEQLTTPIVTLNCEYLVTDGGNEKKIGLMANGVDGAAKNLNDVKNYYFVSTADNSDFNSFTAGNLNTFAIGNTFLTSYSVRASVGDFVRASFSSEGLNAISYTGACTGLLSPALNANGSQYGNLFSIFSGSSFSSGLSPLTKSDIFMEIPIDFGLGVEMSGSNACALQDFSLNLSFPKEDIYRLGSAIPTFNLQTPILVDLDATAILTKWQADVLLQNCETKKDITIFIKKPCTNLLAIQYELKGMSLQRQEVVENLFDQSTISVSWRGYITNVNSETSNFFVRGSVHNDITYSYVLDYTRPIFGYDADGNQFVSRESFYTLTGTIP